jgi:integral membrane protein
VTENALNPRVGGALTRYRVMAIITGSFLIAVFAGFILKPILHVEEGSTFDALTTFIAIAHGWIYMVYLAATIHLWLLMRWGFGRLVVMALGGIVPFLSFALERRYAAEVEGRRAGSLEG